LSASDSDRVLVAWGNPPRELYIVQRPEDFSAFARALHTVTQGRGSAKIVLVTYFGDAAPLYDKLQDLPVDALGFDLTYGSRLASAIAAGSSKPLALGVLDGRTTRLEKTAEVARTVEKLVAKQRQDVILTPSCGLEYLPRSRASDKLHLLAAVRKELK
jgi:5-methyltetrahydropteroyltriglutamate--homocysteine methyltransferase